MPALRPERPGDGIIGEYDALRSDYATVCRTNPTSDSSKPTADTLARRTHPVTSLDHSTRSIANHSANIPHMNAVTIIRICCHWRS